MSKIHPTRINTAGRVDLQQNKHFNIFYSEWFVRHANAIVFIFPDPFFSEKVKPSEVYVLNATAKFQRRQPRQTPFPPNDTNGTQSNRVVGTSNAN
jgi:hypothetical protein